MTALFDFALCQKPHYIPNPDTPFKIANSDVDSGLTYMHALVLGCNTRLEELRALIGEDPEKVRKLLTLKTTKGDTPIDMVIVWPDDDRTVAALELLLSHIDYAGSSGDGDRPLTRAAYLCRSETAYKRLELIFNYTHEHHPTHLNVSNEVGANALIASLYGLPQATRLLLPHYPISSVATKVSHYTVLLCYLQNLSEITITLLPDLEKAGLFQPSHITAAALRLLFTNYTKEKELVLQAMVKYILLTERFEGRNLLGMAVQCGAHDALVELLLDEPPVHPELGRHIRTYHGYMKRFALRLKEREVTSKAFKEGLQLPGALVLTYL